MRPPERSTLASPFAEPASCRPLASSFASMTRPSTGTVPSSAFPAHGQRISRRCEKPIPYSGNLLSFYVPAGSVSRGESSRRLEHGLASMQGDVHSCAHFSRERSTWLDAASSGAVGGGGFQRYPDALGGCQEFSEGLWKSGSSRRRNTRMGRGGGRRRRRGRGRPSSSPLPYPLPQVVWPVSPEVSSQLWARVCPGLRWSGPLRARRLQTLGRPGYA